MNRGDIKLVIDQLHGIELGPETDEVVIFNTVSLLEALGNKVADQAKEIEALKAEIAYRDKTILAMEVTNIGAVSLRLQVSEQAAVIEKLRDSLNGCLEMFDPEAGSSHLHRVLTVKDIKQALAIPTDSRQILADWMREQLGEPTTMVTRYDGIGWQEVYLDQPLYKLPDILK